MTPEAYLPAELRGATIEKIQAGLSGAGVYKVIAGDAAYVLKIADAPIDVTIREAAANAGVAPRIVYVDPSRRGVVSELVVDRGFMPMWVDPQRRPRLLANLGGALRRVHELPIPDGVQPAAPRAHLEQFVSVLSKLDLPTAARDAQDRALSEPEPPIERPIALCHNDVNPTNVLWDGEGVRLLDWDTAAPNDPHYDLAAIAMFLRMDEAACRALIEAHDGVVPSALPARFAYWRRFIAAMCGSIFTMLARQRGYTGNAPGPTMVEAYAEMRAGTLAVGTGEGQWRYGLALLRESLAL